MKKTKTIFLTGALLCGMTYLSQAQQITPARGTLPSTPQFISAADFAKMPAELQVKITSSPLLYQVEGKSQLQTNPQPLEANKTAAKQIVSPEEWKTLSATKQAYIQANPQLFEVSKATPATSKQLVSREEWKTLSSEKQAYLKANLDKYELAD